MDGAGLAWASGQSKNLHWVQPNPVDVLTTAGCISWSESGEKSAELRYETEKGHNIIRGNVEEERCLYFFIFDKFHYLFFMLKNKKYIG